MDVAFLEASLDFLGGIDGDVTRPLSGTELTGAGGVGRSGEGSSIEGEATGCVPVVGRDFLWHGSEGGL